MAERVVVRSLQLGTLGPVLIGGKVEALSGIFKTPADGPVQLRQEGLVGDAIADQAHHGGPDQAAYLYSAEDYVWWQERLEIPLPPGTFGENLTLDRWWPEPRVGDRLTCGAVQLELTAPRIPCATLAGRMRDLKFVPKFIEGNRPGSYARVTGAGELFAGMEMEVTRAAQGVPIQALFDLWYHGRTDVPRLEAALAAPLARRYREACERWRGEALAGKA